VVGDFCTAKKKYAIYSMMEKKKGVVRKPLFWLGGARQAVQDFPLEVRRTIGFALGQAQEGGKYGDAKPLKGFGGAGVLEIVEDYAGDTYRAVYTVKFTGAVYALHAFQKKSKHGRKTPKHDIDLIKNRLRQAEEQYAQWSTSEKENADAGND
jgi:phage-related protein